MACFMHCIPARALVIHFAMKVPSQEVLAAGSLYYVLQPSRMCGSDRAGRILIDPPVGCRALWKPLVRPRKT